MAGRLRTERADSRLSRYPRQLPCTVLRSQATKQRQCGSTDGVAWGEAERSEGVECLAGSAAEAIILEVGGGGLWQALDVLASEQLETASPQPGNAKTGGAHRLTQRAAKGGPREVVVIE